MASSPAKFVRKMNVSVISTLKELQDIKQYCQHVNTIHFCRDVIGLQKRYSHLCDSVPISQVCTLNHIICNNIGLFVMLKNLGIHKSYEVHEGIEMKSAK